MKNIDDDINKYRLAKSILAESEQVVISRPSTIGVKANISSVSNQEGHKNLVKSSLSSSSYKDLKIKNNLNFNPSSFEIIKNESGINKMLKKTKTGVINIKKECLSINKLNDRKKN